MRVPKGWISLMARDIGKVLLGKEMITTELSADDLVKAINDIIYDELMVEDRLNEEVREILKRHEAEIEKGRLYSDTVRRSLPASQR